MATARRTPCVELPATDHQYYFHKKTRLAAVNSCSPSAYSWFKDLICAKPYPGDLGWILKNGPRTNLPHLFLTISQSRDCLYMSLLMVKAKLSCLRGCPPEDPRDMFTVPQEIPPMRPIPIIQNNCVESREIREYCITFMVQKCSFGSTLFGLDITSTFFRFPTAILQEPVLQRRTMSLIEHIIWLNVQYTVCSCTVMCFNGVIQDCPCEKIICPSWGRFLDLAQA